MDFIYKTVLEKARTEYIVDRSRFITTIIPCESRDEVDAFFGEIRKEFKDATHNVPAFILGNKMELKWASDDGEPQGTSGPPILKLLEAKGLTNLAVVVTRYFGGIKLGTGGLVRAYTQSVENAIKEAGIAGAALYNGLNVIMNYSDYSKFTNYKFPVDMKNRLKIGDPSFQENVGFDLSCPVEDTDNLKRILMDMTNGEITISERGEMLCRFALTLD